MDEHQPRLAHPSASSHALIVVLRQNGLHLDYHHHNQHHIPRHHQYSTYQLLEFSRHIPRRLVRLGVMIIFLAARCRVLRPTSLPYHRTPRSNPSLVLLSLMTLHSVIPRVKLAATAAPSPIPMLISTLTVIATTTTPSSTTSRRRGVATRRKLSQLVVSVSKVATFPEPTLPILPSEFNERTIITSVEYGKTIERRIRVVSRPGCPGSSTPEPRCAAARLDFPRTREQTTRAGKPRTRHPSIVSVATHLDVPQPNSGQTWPVAGGTRRTSIETGPEGNPNHASSLDVPHTDPRFCILICPTKSTRPCSSLISVHR
jgi:hypothetical protein